MSRKKKKKRKHKASYINRDRTVRPASQTLKIPEAIQAAIKHHQVGQLQPAEHIYRQVLAADPNNADANHLLGVIVSQAGQNDAAIHLIRKAIRSKPEYAAAHYNLGNALKDQGHLEEAADSYRQALTIKPDYAEAHYNLGNALKDQGQLKEAADSYRQALSIKPDNADAHNNRGIVLKDQGRLEEAADSYRRALSIKPDYADAHNNLGNALNDQGRLKEAADSFRQALTIKPDYAEAHNNLGNVLTKQGRLEEAADSFRQALSIKPDFAEAHNNLGITLKDQGRLEEAVDSYRQALSIKADFAEAHYNHGAVLTIQGRLEEATDSYRQALSIKPDYADAHNNLGNVLTKQGRLKEAAESYRRALSIKPDHDAAHSNLLYGLNYFSNISGKDIYNEALKWDQQHAKTLLKEEPVYQNNKEKERKLRIGYVSPDFRTHSVAYFFEPLLKAHDQENVEVYCYSNVMRPDDVTGRLKAEADNWFSIVGKNDEDVAEQIRSDGIDILVDLAGHTANNRLLVFAYKPAPIQVTWLGYPNTTGMSAIDYRFTDKVADPIGEADNLYSEELIRLGTGFLCYQGDDSAPEISALPCLERGYVTFGSFNNLTKITPEVVKLWSGILRSAPHTHLLLKSTQLLDEEMRARCRGMFEKERISGDRLELLGWLPKQEDHLGLYGKIDIGLDPFPYNGTTTTCEALWMGVPVVTMLGDRHAGRVGASILEHVGLGGLIANGPKSYVEIVLELYKDIEKLTALRNGLRDQMMASPLCDASAFAKNVEEAYFRMWERYVAVCEDKLISKSIEKDSHQPSCYSKLKLTEPSNAQTCNLCDG